MADIAVIVPVLNRPRNAAPLAESLADTTDRARLLFVVSLADTDEQFEACAATGAAVLSVDWQPGRADYAKKIQVGYDATDEPLVLLGADDLRFRPGWLEQVEKIAARYDCGVIGTNDGANPAVLSGVHSTHPVVRRCYIDQLGGVVGQPGQVYCELYDHQWVDTELVATAQARGCYVHAHEARVEHLHPIFNRAVASDATYRKGQARGLEDRRLFASRMHLWEQEAVRA